MTPHNFKSRQELLDRVLDQIALDVHDCEFAAIEELIGHLPDTVLANYLPEYQPEEN